MISAGGKPGRALSSNPHRMVAVLRRPAGMTDSAGPVTSVRAASLGFDDRTGPEPSLREAPAPFWQPHRCTLSCSSGSWTDYSEPLPSPRALGVSTSHGQACWGKVRALCAHPPPEGLLLCILLPSSGIWEMQGRKHPEPSPCDWGENAWSSGNLGAWGQLGQTFNSPCDPS